MSKQPPAVYNATIVASMAEPLTVRAYRINGTNNAPIPMPHSELGGPGTGWTKELLGSLEGFLLAWAGGGNIKVTVIDSAEPPISHEWRFWNAPNEFPPKTPPSNISLADALAWVNDPQAVQAALAGQMYSPPAAPAAAATPAVLTTPPTLMPATPAGTYSPAPLPAPRYPVNQPFFYPAGLPAPTQPVATPLSPKDDQEKRQLVTDNKALQEALQREKETRLQEQHRLELERLRTDSDRKLDELKGAMLSRSEDASAGARFGALEAALAKLAEHVAAKPTGPSEEIRMMQARMEATEREAERLRQEAAAEKREREAERAREKAERDAERREAERERERERDRMEAERRDRETRELIAKQAEDMRRMLDAINNRPQGPDPTMMLIVDMMKSQTSSQQLQMERLQQNTLKPQEIISMMRDASNGVDGIQRQVTGLFGDILNMQNRVMENALQMAPQGDSPVVRLVEGGIHAIQGVAEKIGTAKEISGREQHKAQQAAANAAAEQARVQQRQLEIMAQREHNGYVLNAVNPTENANPDASVNGLNGARVAQAAETKPKIEVVDATKPGKPKKRTDEDWFGVAMPEVTMLRDGVAMYEANAAKEKPVLNDRNELIGTSPENAVRGLLLAIQKINDNELEIPAFNELLAQNEVIAFIEHLLPKASESYRFALAEGLNQALAEMSAPPDEEGGGGGGDEDPDARID